MYDYMKRFCDIRDEGVEEQEPLKLARLIGQLEILSEMCAATYKLPGLCENLAEEILKLRARLESFTVAPTTELPAPEAPAPKTLYKQEYVRCGKGNCRKCASRTGHGPYWYAYTFANGQSHKRYVGLNLPEESRRGHAEVRYALPVVSAPVSPCSQKCEEDNGILKEPCCRLPVLAPLDNTKTG
jgi:hypothetical protein